MQYPKLEFGVMVKTIAFPRLTELQESWPHPLPSGLAGRLHERLAANWRQLNLTLTPIFTLHKTNRANLDQKSKHVIQ